MKLMRSRTLQRPAAWLPWLARCRAGVGLLVDGALGREPAERWRQALRAANFRSRSK